MLSGLVKRLEDWTALAATDHQAALDAFYVGSIYGPWVTGDLIGAPDGASLEGIAGLWVATRFHDQRVPPACLAAMIDGFREYLGHPARATA